jgi:hypothetical protein
MVRALRLLAIGGAFGLTLFSLKFYDTKKKSSTPFPPSPSSFLSPSISHHGEWAEASGRYGAVQSVAANVWQLTGELGPSPLLRWERNMTIWRMKNGDLIIHNAVAVSEEKMREIELLGTPSVLIVPNAHHRRDAHVRLTIFHTFSAFISLFLLLPFSLYPYMIVWTAI